MSSLSFSDLDDCSLAFPSPLVQSGGVGEGDFLKVCRCGQRMLKMRRNGGGWIIVCRGPLLVDPASGESDGNFSNSTSTKANNDQNVLVCLGDALSLPPPPFIFSYTLWMTPRYVSIPGRAMKESNRWLRVRCSDTEPTDKRSFKVLLRFPPAARQQGQPSDPRCIQTLPGQCNRPGQARTCFVRLGIGSENCTLCSWKAAKKTNVFFLQRLCRFFSLSFWPFLFWLAKFSYS